MKNDAFEQVFMWLAQEREAYQTKKFDYDKQRAEVHANESVDFWIQQFDSYIQRLPLWGLNTGQGFQAALKLAATVIALCEYMAENPDLQMPTPGVPSGEGLLRDQTS